MLWNPPPVKVRRHQGRLKPPTAAPPAVNQIVRVTHGDDTDRVVVNLSRPLTAYDDWNKMLSVSASGELWLIAIGFSNADASNLVFIFDEDISEFGFWRVPGPGNYHFEDSEPLVAPFTGEIS